MIDVRRKIRKIISSALALWALCSALLPACAESVQEEPYSDVYGLIACDEESSSFGGDETQTSADEPVVPGEAATSLPSSGITGWLSLAGKDTAMPLWKNVASVSLTFVISETGKATVRYTVTASSGSGNIQAKVYLERKSIIWRRVNIGRSGNEWTDESSSRYLSGTHSVNLKEDGTYRAVVKVSCGGDTVEKKSEFIYKKGVLRGDADGNGKITSSDARKILRHSAQIENLSKSKQEICDINCDGEITALDARIALQISAKLI